MVSEAHKAQRRAEIREMVKIEDMARHVSFIANVAADAAKNEALLLDVCDAIDDVYHRYGLPLPSDKP